MTTSDDSVKTLTGETETPFCFMLSRKPSSQTESTCPGDTSSFCTHADNAIYTRVGNCNTKGQPHLSYKHKHLPDCTHHC